MTVQLAYRLPPRGPARDGSGPGPGFTLIEMLTVLTILGIILALVVGISTYIMAEAARRQTATTQEIVIDAIQRYREATGAVPATGDGTTGPLMSTLAGNPDSNEIIRKLSQDAWAGGSNPLKDAYGNDMTYSSNGGLGGQPLLTSSGSDGIPGNADDIRSDKQ